MAKGGIFPACCIAETGLTWKSDSMQQCVAPQLHSCLHSLPVRLHRSLPICLAAGDMLCLAMYALLQNSKHIVAPLLQISLALRSCQTTLLLCSPRAAGAAAGCSRPSRPTSEPWPAELTWQTCTGTVPWCSSAGLSGCAAGGQLLLAHAVSLSIAQASPCDICHWGPCKQLQQGAGDHPGTILGSHRGCAAKGIAH